MSRQIKERLPQSEQNSVLLAQIAELEEEKQLYSSMSKERAKLEHFLRERVKELNCLYGITELIERCGSSIEQMFQGTVNLIPPSWQYPEITCGRILFEESEYVTENYRASNWKQSADIKLSGKKVGVVEVNYTRQMPEIDEGPFLKEERALIDAIGERLGRAGERVRAEQQLKVERAALKNMNIALREVLSKVQDEKKKVSDAIQANVDNIIMPILHALENEVPQEQKSYVSLLKNNLEEIASPFTDKLSKAFMKLMPAEIRICNMIKNGLSNKEIARLRYITPSTVSRHREHIRHKLGLTNKNINLATYLLTFLSEQVAERRK